MTLIEEQQIRNAISNLEEGNTTLFKVIKTNKRCIAKLKEELDKVLPQLTKEEVKRLNAELASDNWKKTEYYKKHH